jgi:hypothetical protein
MDKPPRKTATVSPKLFKKGDENGFASMEDKAVPQLFKAQ